MHLQCLWFAVKSSHDTLLSRSQTCCWTLVAAASVLCSIGRRGSYYSRPRVGGPGLGWPLGGSSAPGRRAVGSDSVIGRPDLAWPRGGCGGTPGCAAVGGDGAGRPDREGHQRNGRTVGTTTSGFLIQFLSLIPPQSFRLWIKDFFL